MPDQRGDERSAVAAEAGVPWWGAVLIAVAASLIGLAIEAGLGHQELGGIFAVCYALGCLAAVVAVRRSGIFTAVIQPPLLLFVGVPLAYYLFHESAFGGLKDALITCGYPLIERFPLMLFVSAAVLLIGLVRWYRATSAPTPQRSGRQQRAGLVATLSTKLASAFAGNGLVDEDPGARPARPRHVADRADNTRARRGSERGTSRSGRPVKVRGGPPAEEFARVADAPPRPRRQPPRRPVRDDDWTAEDRAEPRRRPRQPQEPRRTPPPPRRERRPRAEMYPGAEIHPGREPNPSRGSRLDPYEPGRGYQPRPQYDPHPAPPPRRRPAPGSPGSDHHPVSRVRYRDSGWSDTDADGPPRSRPIR